MAIRQRDMPTISFCCFVSPGFIVFQKQFSKPCLRAHKRQGCLFTYNLKLYFVTARFLAGNEWSRKLLNMTTGNKKQEIKEVEVPLFQVLVTWSSNFQDSHYSTWTLKKKMDMLSFLIRVIRVFKYRKKLLEK